MTKPATDAKAKRITRLLAEGTCWADSKVQNRYKPTARQSGGFCFVRRTL